MKISTAIGVLAAAALLASTSTLLAQGAVQQTANVVGQGPAGPLVAENGATVTRTNNGVGIAITMPTPPPGSYNYPPPNQFQPVAPVPGTPEVFTGWAFIFNQPENCAVPNQCVPPPPGAPAPNDFTTARGGAHNFAGHSVSGGGALNLVGQISVGESQFGGPFGLESPVGAEIHVAVAPHGVLLPELLPDQFRTPIGSPPFWWLAQFPAAALLGDFDQDGSLDADDIDQLSLQLRTTPDNQSFDLNNDATLSQADREVWVHDRASTFFGDSNLDGEFNSSDLITVFQAAKYELDEEAGWAEGDWNGDGRFDTSDLTAAFQDGGYEIGPRAAVSAVPEPSSAILLVIGIIGISRLGVLRRVER